METQGILIEAEKILLNTLLVLKIQERIPLGSFFLIEANEPVSRKGFLTPGQIPDGNVLHCHPAFKEKP